MPILSENNEKPVCQYMDTSIYALLIIVIEIFITR